MANLPTVKENLFPTKKPHVSYSEIFDWIECSYRHKLKHIEKIAIDNGPTIHTEFGQVVHDAMEDYISQPFDNRKTIDASKYIAKFHTIMQPLLQASEDREVLQKDIDTFSSQMPAILIDAPKWLDEQFPGWVSIGAEHKLYESIEGQNIKFKGFIDAVLSVPKRRKLRKKKDDDSPEDKYEVIEGKFDTYILDWKTTSWGWPAKRKQDFNKQLQIMLYKHFYCTYAGLDLKDAKCGFVLLKRTPSKKARPCELVMVSVGPKAAEKAIFTLNNMINQVKQRRIIKNKYACMWCRYKHTEHCP